MTGTCVHGAAGRGIRPILTSRQGGAAGVSRFLLRGGATAAPHPVTRQKAMLPMIRRLSMAVLLAAAPAFAAADEFLTISDSDAALIRAGIEYGDISDLATASGLPEPRRALEFADQLGLSDEQRAQVQWLADETRAEAKEIGAAYLAAEAALQEAFATGRARSGKVRLMTAEIAELQGRLRYLHLNAHLGMRPLLTAAQFKAYARLTGADG